VPAPRPEDADLVDEALLGSCMGVPRGARRDWVETLAGRYEGVRRAAEEGDGRRRTGTWFTGPREVGLLLDRAMPAAPGARWRACDPACGTGHVLAAAGDRLQSRGWSAARLARALHGMDVDPVAVAIARVRMAVRFGGALPAWRRAIRVGDALAADAWQGARFDAVVGNPPFLGQLSARSARTEEERHARRSRFGGAVTRYADESAAFLLLGTELAPDGRVVLVQPCSVLAAADAQGVRALCSSTHALHEVAMLPARAFGAAVRTCIVSLRPGRASRTSARDEAGRAHFIPAERLRAGRWGAALAAVRGVPEVVLPGAGAAALGSLAAFEADFRQHYYGLKGRVREARGRVPSRGEQALVTSGAIGPASLAWGKHPTRVHGTDFVRPVVRAADLAADRAMGPWHAARSVAKVLVAMQTAVPEAWVDAAGRVLPSVPVVSVRPARSGDLWKVAAAIMAPPIAAESWWRHGGSGMSPGALRLSARDLAAMPAPTDARAWARGGRAMRAWQRRPGSASARRAFAEAMCDAYRVPAGPGRRALVEWWEAAAARAARAAHATGASRSI
jgi:methylase of polypeptide subunit release factors